MNNLSEEEYKNITECLIAAGEIAKEYQNSNALKIEYKEGDSPVTNAEIEINNFLVGKLRSTFPKLSIVSEEEPDSYNTTSTFWLLDPIDGTKNYLKGLKSYSIHLALIHNNYPVFGFMHQPAHDMMLSNYEALGEAAQTQSEVIQFLLDVHKDQEGYSNVFGSHVSVQIEPKAALNKYAIVASGEADAYCICRPSMEWDVAPLHAILKNHGGNVVDMNGNELVYGKPAFRNPSVIACNKKAMKALSL